MNVEALTKIAQSKPVAQPVAQPAASPDLVAQRAEQAMKLVAPFIEKHEGFRQKAYWDKIGKKWTVGHGHTFIRDAKTGNKSELLDKLQRLLVNVHSEVTCGDADKENPRCAERYALDF